ncbi:thiamine phosphate synthase [Lactobacillus sp. ESL0684]|uniref:thiamine phosphate synthase n=1 Tax=Lactobacillus sp. ESL0684 TaxID=2983213 RepID=UPI0023F88704|nr:thiamine phosphate synthase [Lactobacillus sp. ESL0684]WEV43567.1 thiamine phosphate synthase [Lactobacillus sp. ESL0684]
MKKFNSNILQAYFICGSQDIPQGQSLIKIVETALKSGITAFQFRDKGTNSTLKETDRLPMAQHLHELCQAYQVPFFIDDDLALAKKVNAEGIHVGQSDTAIEQVVAEVAGQMLIGYSCSNSTQIKQANQIADIDYYGSGPIFATKSKSDADPEIGIAGLATLVNKSTRPIVAIGGIKETELPAIAQTGAAGAAVISMIAQSNNIAKTVATMNNAPWHK